MRLGLGSYACAWAIGVPGHPVPERSMTACDLVERAEELGLGLVQICDNLPLDALSPAELDVLASRGSALGVEIVVGTRGIAPEHLHTYLGLADRFRSPVLRVVVDTARDHPSSDQVVSTFRALVPDLEAAGVTLAIENHDRFRARELLEIIQRIDSERVGVCLDTVNSFGALEGPEIVVETLGAWVVDLHIKDFCLSRVPHNMGFSLTGRPAGQGQLNVPWLLAALEDSRRECDAIIELWPPPQPDLTDTLALERAWAEESVTYLRQFIHD